MRKPSARRWLLAAVIPLGICARPLEVRLLDPVRSYGGASGASIRAVVTSAYQNREQVWLPVGTVLLGSVEDARPVGIGLARERARLRLGFNAYQLPDGRIFPISVHLRRIDNARETVEADGTIKGIIAANNPQSLVGGLWSRPDTLVLHRSVFGLTGLTGRIWSQFSMGPIGAGALIATRLALIRMPEPEIQLPSGTDLILSVESLSDDAPSFAREQRPSAEAETADWIRALPFEITKPGNRSSKDLINVAIEGSREELEAAFAAAGWQKAEPLNRRSVSRAYHAYTTQTGYASAPASKLFYRGEEPEFIFQKSLNTMAKRHHVRLWRAERDGREIWLGAGTHDIGVMFEPGAMTFSHRIHPRIDGERTKILNDLSFAGCVAQAAYVDRPAAVRKGGADMIYSDGRIASIRLQACAGTDAAVDQSALKPLRWPAARMVRRAVLEARNYVLRGNPYYWAYRAIRWRPSAQELHMPGVEE